MQMTLVNFQTMQSLLSKDEQVIMSGHKYWDHTTNEWWMEFHVNDHDFENCDVGPYGGNHFVSQNSYLAKTRVFSINSPSVDNSGQVLWVSKQ